MGDYEGCARYVQSLLRSDLRNPEVMIICGSGLSGLSANFSAAQTINYSDIPGFPQATVPGHHGELVFGHLNSLRCVCMRGRFHFYEGNSMDNVVFPVRVARCMGAKMLLVTNAAGGLNPNFNVGDIVVLQDHFALPCLAGNHPLRGPNDSHLGPRFFATSDAYDDELQNVVLESAKTLDLQKYVRPNGIYCYVSGPSYESKVECRFLRSLGGDAVGMSTIPEVLAARHCGMKILGLSLITNKVISGDESAEAATHEEVLGAVKESGIRVESLVRAVVQERRLRAILDQVSEKTPSPESDESAGTTQNEAARTTMCIVPVILGLWYYVMKNKTTSA